MKCGVAYLIVLPQGPPDADVQREVAAALESVFPRVGLKAFVSLSSEDKSSQVSSNSVADVLLLLVPVRCLMFYLTYAIHRFGVLNGVFACS